MELAQRLDRIAESQTILMSKLSRELKAKGMDIIDLSLGEPDFDTPKHIREAAKKAIDEGYTHYTPVAGYADLRQAVVHKLKRDNGLDYTPEQVVVSTGAKQSIANVMLSVLNPGDEVLIPTPYWVSYADLVKLSEGTVKLIPGSMENGYKITAGQLEAAITPATKLIIYSSPCNPSGAVFSRAELAAMAEVLKKYPRILIISDEIYEYINYNGGHESIAQFDFLKDRVIIVNGLSKGFAMTGWRLGYIAAPLAIAKACDKIQSQITSGTCSITQRAAIAALKEDLRPSREMVEEFRRRRDYMVNAFRGIPGFVLREPPGAFYVFPRVDSYFGKSDGETTIRNADDFSMYLLNKAHVSSVTGAAFGEPNCVRFSYAASMEKLQEGVRRIKEAAGKLK